VSGELWKQRFAAAFYGFARRFMAIEIRREDPGALATYASVSVAFRVDSVLDVADSGGHFTLRERRLHQPFAKDYDAIPGNGPLTWSDRFPINEWGLFSARLNGSWVGAAAIAPDPTLVPGASPSSAVLWDLRVSPHHRGSGVGRRLFAAAEEWARRRSCVMLFAETQNINVAACRFYEHQGCVLDRIDRAAYPAFVGEVQLIWRKELILGQ